MAPKHVIQNDGEYIQHHQLKEMFIASIYALKKDVNEYLDTMKLEVIEGIQAKITELDDDMLDYLSRLQNTVEVYSSDAEKELAVHAIEDDLQLEVTISAQKKFKDSVQSISDKAAGRPLTPLEIIQMNAARSLRDELAHQIYVYNEKKKNKGL